MEMNSRGSSLKRQLADAFAFTEDSVPEMKKRDFVSGNDSVNSSNPSENLLFEASFKVPSRPRSKPSSNPERRVKRDTMPPVTPSKTESQAANSENEVQEETNSVHTKQKRKKYKPKVVSDGASSKKPTKSPGNSKSVASDLKAKNANAPITPDPKSQCPRVPITPEPKLETHEVPTECGTKLTTPQTPVSCEPKPTHHEIPLSVDSIPQLKRVQVTVTPDADCLNAEADTTPDLTCVDSETAVQSDLKPENVSFTNAAGLKIENLEAPITPDPKSHTPVKKKRGRPFGTNKKTTDPKLHTLAKKKRGRPFGTNKKTTDPKSHTLVKKKRGRPFGTNKKTTTTDLGLEKPSSGVQLNNDSVTKPTKSVRRQLNFGAENHTKQVSNEETITATNLNPNDSIVNPNPGDANEHQESLQQGLHSGPEAENKPVVDEENTSVTTKSADCSTDNATDLNCPNLVVNGLNVDLRDNLEAKVHGGMCVDSDLKLNQDDTEIVRCLMDVIDRVGFDRVDFKDYLINLAAQRSKGVKRGRTKQSPKLSFDEMLEEIVLKMTHLKLYENALVLYQERKEKYRGIVALDEDSLKEWNILMGEGSNSAPEFNPEREEKWRKERDTFRNLAEWFIAKMKLIQGDRCFSEWKGSVVDSVVGAFLTQNVSDQLSSSAFISLCARYPRRKDVNVTCPENKFPESEEKKSQIVNEQSCASDIVDPHIEGGPGKVLKDSLNLELTKEISGSPEVQKSNESKKNGYKSGMEHIDWDALRKEAYLRHTREGRSATEHAADWDAVRQTETIEVAKAIHGRGQDNVLAERIQNFLNRVVKEHGSMDLEWLRDIPGDQAKEYLLSIYGLGLKSVECVRLLTLHQVAFPVDTNVGRIAVRLGWVPLQPLPESVQMHLLEMYPVMDSIQKYLWPRLCKLDQKTLYELHYQMITFGKVFCTKSKPNCNACPLRSDCKHFASAFASARLMLPGPQENQDNKVVRWNGAPTAFENTSISFFNPANVPAAQFADVPRSSNSEPIIEEPMTPEEEQRVEEIPDIEDLCFDDPDEIPTINLNMESFVRNIEEVVKNNDSELQIEDISKALVLLPPIAASVPPPILKHSRHLRTVHEAYEIPDGHPILRRLEFEERDQADPSPYLLILYLPEKGIDWEPCGCNSCKEAKRYHFVPEDENEYVKCTLTIPCRTAMRGSFPLNGTYFQVNEVFADHCTARNPIMVPREEIWRLRKRFVYFGSTVSSILKGLPTEEIQHCFWRGFVCVREFDRTTRYPKPLSPWLHLLPTVRRKIGSTQ